MERHVLSILAHPDDELACAGTLILHRRAGTPVTHVCATRGEMGRRMGRPPFATRESMGAIREQELRSACAIMDIHDVRFLDIWDKTVEFVNQATLVNRVKTIIDEVQPSLVITFHPVHGRHPDHNAIGAATLRAAKAIHPAERPAVHLIAMGQTHVPLQRLVVDYTPVKAIKDEAREAHQTQMQGIREWLEHKYRDDPETLERLLHVKPEEHFWVYKF